MSDIVERQESGWSVSEDNTSDIVDRITRGWPEGSPEVLLGIACREIVEIRKKRDEARGLYLQRNYRGEQLERDLADAIKQRDDARRWLRDACAEIARTRLGVYDTLTPQQIAERNGWDCFAQEGGGA